MDDLKPQRRPFQFSLRKLMLWMAVWALYLGMLRWIEVRVEWASVVSIWLAVPLAIRAKWGFERGVVLAALATTLVWNCLQTVVVLQMENSFDTPFKVFGLFPIICIMGLTLGLCGFVLVHSVAKAVDWFDDLVETKTPQDQ